MKIGAGRESLRGVLWLLRDMLAKPNGERRPLARPRGWTVNYWKILCCLALGRLGWELLRTKYASTTGISFVKLGLGDMPNRRKPEIYEPELSEISDLLK